MSLLNKMLRDLDTRRAADSERQSLPGEVRPLPAMVKRSPIPMILAGAALLMGAAGLAWWAPWKPATPPGLASPPVTVPAPPPVAQAVVATPSPVAGVSPTPDAPVQAPVQPQISAPEALRLERSLHESAPASSAVVKPESRKPAPAPTTAGANRERASDTRGDSTGNAYPQGRVDKSPSLLSPQGQADVEYRRAQGLLAQGNLSEAENALNQALRLVPEHAAARQALFGLLVEQQRKDEARLLLEAGIAILPGHSSWAMNVARIKMEKNDAAGAWETLQQGLASAQSNGEYRAFCGTVLQRLGRSQEAIPHFHAALRINPGEGRWWLGLGLVLESAAHPAEAREAYARAKASGSLPADLAAFAEQKSRQ